jgi:hypothetical protein
VNHVREGNGGCRVKDAEKMLEASQIPNFLVGFALAFAQIRRPLPGSALAGLPKVVAFDVPLFWEVISDARAVRGFAANESNGRNQRPNPHGLSLLFKRDKSILGR